MINNRLFTVLIIILSFIHEIFYKTLMSLWIIEYILPSNITRNNINFSIHVQDDKHDNKYDDSKHNSKYDDSKHINIHKIRHYFRFSITLSLKSLKAYYPTLQDSFVVIVNKKSYLIHVNENTVNGVKTNLFTFLMNYNY